MPRTRPRPSAHSAASPLPARPGVAQDRSRRWVVLAYGSLALMVLVLTMPYRVGVADTFVQLRIGEYILQHGIPHIDPFSYMSPFAGHPYVEHEWLTCILFSLLYQYLGVGGLVLYKVVCVGLASVCLVRTARRLGASHGAIVLVGAGALLLLGDPGRSSAVCNPPPLLDTATATTYWTVSGLIIGHISPCLPNGR